MRRIRSQILGGFEESREGFVGTAAALVGGALAAGGSVAAGVIGSSAAGDATDKNIAAQRQATAAQQRMFEQSLALQQKQYDQSRADLQPFRDAQVQALGQLQGLADPNNPIYQQQRQISQEQVQRQLSAQGLLRSTAQGDQLSNIEVGLANQRAQIIGGIAGNGAGQAQAGLAQNYGSSLAQMYGQQSQQIGSGLSNIGQIGAQGAMAQGQALAGAVGGVGNAFSGTLANLYAQNQQSLLWDKLAAARGGQGNYPGNALNPNQWFNK